MGMGWGGEGGSRQSIARVPWGKAVNADCGVLRVTEQGEMPRGGDSAARRRAAGSRDGRAGRAAAGLLGQRTSDIAAVLGPASYRLCPAHGTHRVSALLPHGDTGTQPPGAQFPSGATEQHGGALPCFESRDQHAGRRAAAEQGQEAPSRREGVC